MHGLRPRMVEDITQREMKRRVMTVYRGLSGRRGVDGTGGCRLHYAAYRGDEAVRTGTRRGAETRFSAPHGRYGHAETGYKLRHHPDAVEIGIRYGTHRSGGDKYRGVPAPAAVLPYARRWLSGSEQTRFLRRLLYAPRYSGRGVCQPCRTVGEAGRRMGTKEPASWTENGVGLMPGGISEPAASTSTSVTDTITHDDGQGMDGIYGAREYILS